MEIIRGVPVTGGIVMGKILKFSSAPLSQKTLLQKLSRPGRYREDKDPEGQPL